MKRFNALCLFVTAAILTALLFVACQDTSLKQWANGLNQNAQEFKEQVHATTQPQVLPDGTVIPAMTLPAKVIKGADKLADNVAKGAAVVNAVPETSQDDPGAFVRAIAPFTGNYAGLVYLIGAGISTATAVIKNSKAKKEAAARVKSDDALQKTADALGMADANKHITVAPAAVTMANSIIPDHPIANKIVDALSDAAGTPRIPE